MSAAATYSVLDKKKPTPQTEAIPGSTQVLNNAKGYAWEIDDWIRLDRFLTLGSEGGTAYVGERPLTIQNAQAVKRCVQADGTRAVNTIVRVSVDGRAAKNDPALFALVIAASYGDASTRAYALSNLNQVARTGTMLLHFAQYVKGMRGTGRGLRKAFAWWYESKSPEKLSYQVVKYGSRDGWSHRDILRLTHPKAFAGSTHQEIYHYVTKGWESVGDEPHPNEDLQLIWAYERAKVATTEDEIASLISTYGLTHEMLPTQWKTSMAVWQALLEDMPITALIRNLATLSRVGLIGTGKGSTTAKIAEKIVDADRLKKGRVHPIALLAALKTYASGKGDRGSNTWTPSPKIVDALNDAFYASFGNVEPTNKRLMLALDVSGSMAGTQVNGIRNLSAREACGAQALITAAVEPDYMITAFDYNLYTTTFSARQRLDDVVNQLSQIGGGGTDCAIPIVYATKEKIPVDAFVIYTDSETWAGRVHPAQAIQAYRKATGIPAKLVVVAMAATNISIADPTDAGQLNVVGMDTATPGLISQFIKE